MKSIANMYMGIVMRRSRGKRARSFFESVSKMEKVAHELGENKIFYQLDIIFRS